MPHVVNSESARQTDIIFEKFNLPESYRYKNQSLLSAIALIFTDVPRTILQEHYRCSPKIIEFCNKKFYNDQLIIMTEEKPNHIPFIVYKTADGNHERNRMNQRQIDIIKDEIIPFLGINIDDDSLGLGNK